jgi:hypothetical protein
MEANISSTQPSQEDQPVDAIKKAESAREFDALYSMDALSLQDGSAVPSKASTPVNNGRMLAGSSFPRTPVPSKGQVPPAHSFSECQSSSFSLRVGPNYAKLGNKAPAGQSLYESVGAEYDPFTPFIVFLLCRDLRPFYISLCFISPTSFVRCQSRIDDFASKVNLPEDWVNIDTHHPNIPQLFVVNVQVCSSFFALSWLVEISRDP